MSALVLEVVTFKLANDVNPDQFVETVTKMESVLGTTAGYIGRELTAGEDGQWIDILRWESMIDAQAAPEAVMATPIGGQFMQMIDPQSVSMFHTEMKYASTM